MERINKNAARFWFTGILFSIISSLYKTRDLYVKTLKANKPRPNVEKEQERKAELKTLQTSVTTFPFEFSRCEMLIRCWEQSSPRRSQTASPRCPRHLHPCQHPRLPQLRRWTHWSHWVSHKHSRSLLPKPVQTETDTSPCTSSTVTAIMGLQSQAQKVLGSSK